VMVFQAKNEKDVREYFLKMTELVDRFEGMRHQVFLLCGWQAVHKTFHFEVLNG
jgi:hypothetical protein